MSREDAYSLVQGHAMNAWTNDLNFRALIGSDPEVNRRLSLEEIASAFDVRRQLTNVDEVFARVLAEG